MKRKIFLLIFLIILLIPLIGLSKMNDKSLVKGESIVAPKESYWFMLHRKSNLEYLYFGIPGEIDHSKVMRKFQVKTGASWSPTPLPELLGRDYWKIVKKESSIDNPDTSPYFLQLDVPVDDSWPFGPVPYMECKDIYTGEDIQCDWVQPGYFGLHGIGGNQNKLSVEDLGSSGCIRHKDEDITYLYNLLNPELDEIRYYVKDI